MTTRDELEHRRREIAGAALRVLARDGLRALSVRNVAAEAGLAPSSLRYAVPTQASLREQAMELLLERLQQRIGAAGEPAGIPWARAVLHELLPLDATRRVEMEVTLELGTAAMTDEALVPLHLQLHEAIRGVCAEALSALCGDADLRVRAVETARLHALVDGLALHVVRRPPGTGEEEAITALDRHLASLATR
ncbi:TetR family transcriptional regulator C-terminal domain-containing protein [Brachybacterium sp. J144]|uniref:TetR/AcrR family transcriptional regulator n=1 Tax=Brachybacterium sp. J144 TaxID=3116487 RepID=UPI002E75EC15|nr:TetR family transcriptional regulator C-terminal domain-containing protein [Brachybacterium sp. J144]MEE1651147.1 TetR family transcriptional regulator C-terminal domain-containing protein [Brachybacterium sp. J144]